MSLRGPAPALAAALLGLAAAGFAALAAFPFLAAPPEAAGASRAGAEAPMAAPPAPPAETPPTDLEPFLERPLFSAARRPPPPEAPGIPLADPRADLLFGRWEIAGVVQSGAGAVALLRDEDGRLVRLRAGDRIPTSEGDEAEVLSVALDALTFRRRGATVAAPVRRGGAGTE